MTIRRVASLAPAVLLLTLVVTVPSARAADYYVSPAGQDNNSGTSPSDPWKTLRNVNNATLAAGDRVLLQGGQTFGNTLNLGADDTGTPTDPIVITSYGTGRATIAPGSNSGIVVYNTAGVRIENIDLQGAGYMQNNGSGILLYADLPGDVKMPYVAIDNVTAAGFGSAGIEIGGWNNATGFRDITITHVIVSSNGKAGIRSYAMIPNVHQNVYIGFSQAFSNPGFDTRQTTNESTGSGISLGAVDGATIERCEVHDNGTGAVASSGPQGIWAYYSRSVTMQYNESYNNHTGGWADGGGFGLDVGVTDSLVQYNYAHGNDGAAFIMAGGFDPHPHGNNTIRYNISQNDARRNGYGAIEIWGKTSGTQFFDNTIYTAADDAGQAGAVVITNDFADGNYAVGVGFRNNVFYTTGGIPGVELTEGALAGSSVRFEGNDYYSTLGPRILWGGATFTSLADWRAASSEETVNGAPTGSSLDPLLTSPGGGATIGNPSNLPSLTAYQLQAGSPMIDRGLGLSQFGIDPGTQDFYGTALYQGSGVDVGAHERVPSAPTNVPPTVSITAPANGATFTAPAAITIAATGADSDGAVARVDFYNGSSPLGSDASAPYSVTWTNAPAGTYTFTAVATDDSGASTTSNPVSITVSAEQGGTSTPFGGTPAAVPGTIQAENFDNGGEGVAYHDLTPGNSGGAYRSTGVDVEATADAGGGYDVGWISAGEWLNYSVSVASAATYTLQTRVASNGQGGTFHIEVNGVNKTGPLTIPDTGGWQSWTTVTSSIALDAGTQILRVLFDAAGPSSAVGNLNALVVSSGSTLQSTPFGGNPAAIPGTIEAERFDDGGEGVAYHDATSGNSGGQFRTTDVDVEAAGDTGGGYDVGWISASEWLNFTVNVAAAGSYTLDARVACNGAGGTFHVEVGGVNKTGPLSIPNTGGWQSWTDVSVPITLDAGAQVLRVVFDSVGSSGAVGNLNFMRLSSGGAPPPPPAPEVALYDSDVAAASVHGSTLAPDSAGNKMTIAPKP